MKRHATLRFLTFLLLMMCCATGIRAQLNRYIYGDVHDRLTDRLLEGVKAVLLTTDSTAVDSMFTGQKGQTNDKPKCWMFGVPDAKSDYIVAFYHDGYDPQYLKVRVSPSGRKQYYDFGTVRLMRAKERHLGTATVTASRVKIFTRKDTLIFNADAFNIAEGSMLDALIRQLPGVVLKDDGRIFVNGKFVESLQLNGDDFFKGNNSVLLENLPSYMVKDVKVYERQGELGRALGKKMQDETYVMDIRLKKQYAIGWIANAEVAAGSADRYLGRLFALRFTPQSRLSVFGNINNLNENRKPGENGDWTPANMPSGLTALKTAGVDYSVKDSRKRYEISGNATVRHTDTDNASRTYATNFLPLGDTYGHTASRHTACNTSLSTSHRFYLPGRMTSLWLWPSLSYSSYTNRSASAAATFTADVSDVTGLTDSIMSGNSSALLQRLAVNRTVAEGLTDGRDLTTGISFTVAQKFNRSDDNLIVNGYVNYYDKAADRYDRYRLDYPASPTAAGTAYNRYNRDRPDWHLIYSATAEYYYWLPGNMAIVPTYRYYGAHSSARHALYRLDKLAGWDDATALGQLPSVSEYLSTIDDGNSYDRRLDESEHYFAVNVRRENNVKNGYLKFSVTLPLRVTSHRLDYERGTIDTVSRKTWLNFEPLASITYSWDNWNQYVWFSYTGKGRINPLLFRLPTRDDEDPLSITVGNANLTDGYSHTVSMSYTRNRPSAQRFFSTRADYSVSTNALAYAYTYDRTTGARIYTPQNVNGNYSVSAGVNYNMALGKRRRVNWSTSTDARYGNSVDLVATDGTDHFARSGVRTLWLSETLKLDYSIDAVKIGGKLGAAWHHAEGSREDFSTVNAANFNYGLTAQVKLPWDMQFNTDLTMYSRRGYGDNALNTDDLVWNARLAKRCLKGGLTLAIDGFDILHNLSAITTVLNAQGRTETYRNVIPRYCMLNVIYRLNIKPKKRPGDE